VVGKEGVVPEVEGLRSCLKERLPEYMIPAAFVVLENFPLTPNGKWIGRIYRHQRWQYKEYMAPRNEERSYWRDIQQVLRVDRVGVQDNFFELGGDSILSIQIVARANTVGLKLTPRQLFEHQTVAEWRKWQEKRRETSRAGNGEWSSGVDADSALVFRAGNGAGGTL